MKTKAIIIKKPQQKRSKAKFETILQACPRVLTELGYEKTTTARLALEADVSIGSLYDYFSCKEAIVIAYLDFELNKAMDTAAYQAKHASLDPKLTIKALIASGVDFAYEQRAVIRVVFTEFPALLHKIDLAESREKVMVIAADFAASKHIDIAHADIRLMLFSLTNIILGFQVRIALMSDEGIQREAIIDELTSIVNLYLFA